MKIGIIVLSFSTLIAHLVLASTPRIAWGLDSSPDFWVQYDFFYSPLSLPILTKGELHIHLSWKQLVIIRDVSLKQGCMKHVVHSSLRQVWKSVNKEILVVEVHQQFIGSDKIWANQALGESNVLGWSIKQIILLQRQEGFLIWKWIVNN